MELTLDQALQKGIEAHKAGKAQEADRYYTAILKANPKHPDANHNMGVLAVGVGKVEAALPYFKTALETNSNIAQYWLSYIDALIKLDRMADAKAVLEQAKSQGAKGVTEYVFDKIGTRLAKLNTGNKKKAELPEFEMQSLINLLSQGEHQKALAKALWLLTRFPNSASLHNIIGAIYQSLGELATALKAYKKALVVNPDYADAHNNMGVVLQNQGKLEQALNAYAKGISLNPNNTQAYVNLGNTLKEQSNLEEALEAYKKALSLTPNSIEIQNNIGIVLKDMGRLEKALEAYKQTLVLKPDYAEAYYNMGTVLKEQGKLDEAISSYAKAISLKPDYAEAYNNIGLVLQIRCRLEEAIVAYKKAISIKHDYALAYYNMGITLKDQGNLTEAISIYEKALSVKPNYPEAHLNLAFVLLNSGRVKEGLDEYEWRWKTAKRLSANRHFSQPRWDGQRSLKGKKILLWSEQGVGDTINWSSGLSVVASEAGHCILECQQKLVTLLARSLPNVEVKSQDTRIDSKRDDFDFHLPLGSLYNHFIPQISPKNKSNVFLIPDPIRVSFWRKRLNSLGKGPYIGISWKSSNMSYERLPNYASISDLSPILKIPNITFINLQYKDFESDLTKIEDEIGVKVHNFDDLDQFENLEDVAALSAALDIIVSTHNVLIMIAPRVGTPTKFASWRQSTWNNILLSPKGPTIKKFHRNTWEPWDDVFRSIAEDIMNNEIKN